MKMGEIPRGMDKKPCDNNKLNLASPTDNMTKCIKKYNLESAQKLITDGKLIDGIKEMKTQLDGLTAKEKTAVISTIAGKEALSGVSALLNSSTKDINNLKFAVDSSTKSSRAYAESLGLIDKEGNMLIKDLDNMTKEQQKSYKQWENFNSIMDETTDVMTMVGGSTTDLGSIVAKLGEDGKVSADNVNDLLNVFDKLQDTSEGTTNALKEYGIEIQRNDDGSLNFKETLKSLGTVWDKLSNSEKKSLANKLGLSASVEELNELYSDEGEKIEDLVEAYEQMEGVSEHLAKSFDATLKGSILNLSSAIEERLLQVFDKLKPSIQGLTDTLTEFFNIWNGMSETNGKGLGNALSYLAEQSKGWGTSIKNAISDAFKSLDEFINGKNFDNVLQIGTNIIDGICKGILQARDNGTLADSIDGIIKKICEWVETNAPKLQEGAKAIIDAIKNGISNNRDKINSAFEQVFKLVETFLRGKKDIFNEIGVTCGATFIEGAIKGLLQDAISGIGTAFATIMSSIGQLTADFLQAGIDLGKALLDGIMEAFGVADEWAKGKQQLQNMVDWLWDLNGENNTTSKAQDSGVSDGKRYNEGINNSLEETKTSTSQKASEIGQGISDNIVQKLETMDASALQSLGTELQNLQTTTQTVASGMGTSFANITNSARTNFMNLVNICRNQMINMSNICRNQFVNIANICRNQMVNCANICRNQFLSMANVARNQMLNISNIVRNQAVSWSNIIRNQVTNARNALTQQFISMRNVARTQMLGISSIIRNQAVNWANIVRNQASNMRNAFTSQMMSMSAVARNQMANVYSTVSSYMSRIASSVNRSMELKVNVAKTITTTNVTKNVNVPGTGTMSLSSLSDMASNTFSALSSSSSYGMSSMRASSSMGLGTALNAVANSGNQAPITIEVPLTLNGREIAKATATYNQAELNKLSRRNSRKRGE